MAEFNSDGYSLPELHRIKGELLVQSVDLALTKDLPHDPAANSGEICPTLVEAQSCFAEALAIARQQQTRSWELRAHLSMDRLVRRQGQAMHTQLVDSYSSFSEGFETSDLKQARTQLGAASGS
jgi:hypothetical protein